MSLFFELNNFAGNDKLWMVRKVNHSFGVSPEGICIQKCKYCGFAPSVGQIAKNYANNILLLFSPNDPDVTKQTPKSHLGAPEQARPEPD